MLFLIPCAVGTRKRRLDCLGRCVFVNGDLITEPTHPSYSVASFTCPSRSGPDVCISRDIVYIEAHLDDRDMRLTDSSLYLTSLFLLRGGTNVLLAGGPCSTSISGGSVALWTWVGICWGIHPTTIHSGNERSWRRGQCLISFYPAI